MNTSCHHCPTFETVQAENVELRAKLAHYEQHELAHKRPFSDRFAQRVIAEQVREIDRLSSELIDARRAREGAK